MSAAKVSFTVRRPTPVSRQSSAGPDSDSGFKIPAIPSRLTTSGRSSPLANGSHKKPQFIPHEGDSSDEEDEVIDEMVTGFDQFGVQRSGNGKKKGPEGPLVIPSLANRDWRELARKRKAAEMFVPEAGKAAMDTGADGSVGGLGTKDTINSGTQLAGLVHVEKRAKEEGSGDITMTETEVETVEVTQESEDDRALKALLAEASGEKSGNTSSIAAIPSNIDDFRRPADEGEAYRRDVVSRPDSATMEDYERVPVEEFGEALLRGMGWKPGQPASRTRQGPTQPYLPQQRPALLGLGAKEREVVDDGSIKLGKFKARPDKRYIPVAKVAKDKDDGRRSGTASRRSSRSPDPDRRRDRDRHDDGERDRRKRDTREYESDRERERRKRDHDSDRERRRDKDTRRDYRGDEKDHHRRGERSRDTDRERDRDRR